MPAKGSFKLSDEAKKKISEWRKRQIAERGFLNSPETRKKISEANKGRRMSDSCRQKIANANRGRAMSESTKLKLAEARKGMVFPKGEDSYGWKGDDVGYGGLHSWVARTLGRPSKCERCGTEEARKYEWANISLEYRRDVSDWERLCIPCHRKQGYVNGEYVPWNKGKKVQSNTGRTHIKPGQRISVGTEFKPGQVPHNKRLVPRPCGSCGKEFQPLDDTRKYCCLPCYWQSLRTKDE